MSYVEFPIKVVSRRTGLTAHVIRAWERRYGAVMPRRTDTNRRLYSDEDIKRLIMLKQLVERGNNISQIASLDNDTLMDMLGKSQWSGLPMNGSNSYNYKSKQLIDAVLSAAENMDADAIENKLNRAMVELGRKEFIDQVVMPLLTSVGDGWRSGSLRIAHEHLVSVVLRNLLGTLRESIAGDQSSPLIVITTPMGQLHELGALAAAIVAQSEGWRVQYLGPNLPAEEIAGAVRQMDARAVALSIVYPPDDHYLIDELNKLRSTIPPETALFVGGNAARNYDSVLIHTGALRLENFQEFREQLARIRHL
ncbi:MerR family transcriptional regulator [bacterium]|nr:MerR family transcriptional regulator [candidate division CSSED10-310 bacterium]